MSSYSPPGPLTAVCWIPRSVCAATMLAPAITAPEGSVTVPLMSPDAPTPCARATPHARKKPNTTTPNLFMDAPCEKPGPLRGDAEREDERLQTCARESA